MHSTATDFMSCFFNDDLSIVELGNVQKVLHMCVLHSIRDVHRMLFGKPGGNRPLGRPRPKWEDNIRTDLREIGWDGVDWLHLA